MLAATFGFVFVYLIRPNRMLSAVACFGIIFSAVVFLRTSTWVNPEAQLSTYFWAYGYIVVTPLGALFGAFVWQGVAGSPQRKPA